MYFVISRFDYCFYMFYALTASDTLSFRCQVPENETLDCVVRNISF